MGEARNVTERFLSFRMVGDRRESDTLIMRLFIAYIVAFLSLIFLCTIFPQKAFSEMQETQRSPERTGQKNRTEREAKAYEIFEKILALSNEPDKKDVFGRIEKLYLEIIRDYPDTALAQECYWRLITHYLENAAPPMFEKAEKMHEEFLKRYPESVIGNLIVDTLSRGYYNGAAWEKLARLNLPVVSNFYETGKAFNPLPLFMYAEAQFNLGNFQEAERVYRSVVERFPESRQAFLSKERLDGMHYKNK